MEINFNDFLPTKYVFELSLFDCCHWEMNTKEMEVHPIHPYAGFA